MKYPSILLLTAVISLLFLSCASIVSKSTYPLHITSEPSGAKVVVKNWDGMEVYNGNSPALVNLDAGAKFFKRASYTVTFSADGYNAQTIPVNFKVDGWYFGNLLLGGVIGMLIIDPATGAMYKITSENMSATLSSADSGMVPQLRVYDLTQVPDSWRGHLERVTR